MANTNTDLTEEDAADLQFPKDDSLLLPNEATANIFENSYCSNCFSEIVSQCIFCEMCKVPICSACFANGAEFLNHKNDHAYRVLTTNFTLFENSDWTADEELKLLDCVLSYGNWNLVALEFPNRTVIEVKEHYEYFYLEGNGHNNMPKFKELRSAVFPEITVPYNFRLTDNEDPPRYASNTIGFQALAGYNAARGDFENEYDKNAEGLLSSLERVEKDDPQFKVLSDLQFAIVKSYNRRLQERQRWKKIVSQHGLLVHRKVNAWLHRYEQTMTKPVYEKCIRFMHFCEPVKFEMIMEGLHRAGELKIQIQRLIELRKKGITTIAEGKMYLKLQEIHEKNRKQLKSFRSAPQFNLRASKNASFAIIPKPFKRRGSFAPIEIIGMPGYDSLTDKEKDLCRLIRLVPATYLELKEILVSENQKSGLVKLKTARRLLKIDVNKTRRLYDFLVSEAYISKTF